MEKSFIVTAIPSGNLLKIILRGFFLKSEVELALHLIKTEKIKLKEGFRVSIDISKFQSKSTDLMSLHYKIQQLVKPHKAFQTSGGSLIETEYSEQSVGFYPYEIA
jgi:hypothetical protein